MQGNQVPGIRVIPVTISHLTAYRLDHCMPFHVLFSCQEGEVGVGEEWLGERVIPPPESKGREFPSGRG